MGNPLTTNPANKTANSGAYTITTGAAQVLPRTPGRQKAVFLNNGATNVVYLGRDATVTSANGYPVAVNGGTFTDDTSADAWWAVTAASTSDLRVLEFA